MKKQGFVYLLRNRAMPDLVKVGCTAYPPAMRASELSRATGVPTPFEVVCFIETDVCLAAERDFHNMLATDRPNSAREFFSARHRGWVVGLFEHCRGARSFTDFAVDDFLGSQSWMRGVDPYFVDYDDRLEMARLSVRPDAPRPETIYA